MHTAWLNLNRYSAWLIQSPYKSNMLSMGAVMLVGDATAQRMEGQDYNKVRGAVMVSWCGCFYSPFFVKYWGVLNRVLPKPVCSLLSLSQYLPAS